MDDAVGGQAACDLASLIHKSDWPAALVGLDRHTFGTQREQLGWLPVKPGQNFDIGIAMQQQMRRDGLHQRLPGRGGLQ